MISSPISKLPATEFLTAGPSTAPTLIVLAHGAGAAMDTPFMETISNGLAGAGHRVLRFEFPYMQRRRRTAIKAPPDRPPVLLASWQKALRDARDASPHHQQCIVGGKSMGGRIASMLADEVEADGLICLGYPFHPPGKPDRLRVDHLQSLRCRSLILQGERDTMGCRDEVAGYRLSAAIKLCWLSDGDHSLKPRRASGHTEADNLAAAIAAINHFLTTL